MEELIKQTIINEEKRKGRQKNINLEVHVLKPQDSEEKYITTIIKDEKSGSFRTTNSSCLNDQKRGYYLFRCTRSGQVSRGSRRTTGCKAYISFNVNNDWKGHKVIVQRIFSQHNGHTEDGHFQRIHPNLVNQINQWITLGVKPDIILLQANEWSRAQGHSNCHNREYFVTPEDIHNIRTGMLRRKHLDKDDCKSTEKLLAGPFKEHVIFYQPLSKDQELVIVLQTECMRNNLKEYGKNILFFDATHCVNQYSFPLFTLLVRDDHGHGIPVAYIITSSENQETLKLALQKLRPLFPNPPRCFMVDKDMSEINALKEVFPESDVLLCWYHVLQAVVRWLMQSHSGVSGPSNSSTRRDILDFFKKMKACAMKTDFRKISKNFLRDFSDFPEVCHYFQKHWEPISHTWADFGRCYDHGDSETNNLVERFFHRLKYQFLSGVRNRRMDDLLHVILCQTETYFQVIKNLQSVGRVQNRVNMKSEETLNKAVGLLAKGWIDKIALKSSQTYFYDVPSEQDPGFSYRTCPAECFCSCPVGVRGQICKHLTLLDLLKDKDSYNFPDLALQLEAHARVVKETSQFSVCSQMTKEIDVQSLCGRGTYHASVIRHSCTCCTFSYHGMCPCLIVAAQLFGTTINEAKDCSGDQVDSPDMFSEPQDKSIHIKKLEDILQITKRLQTVPENIKRQIDDLHANVCQEDSSLLLGRRHSDDTSRKIQPIFPNRAKYRKKTGKLLVPKKGNVTLSKSEEGFRLKVRGKTQEKRKYRARLHL